VLNSTERQTLTEYIKKTDRWSKISQICSKKSICCVVSNINPFFDPGSYNLGIRMGLRDFKLKLNTHFNRLVITDPIYVYPYGSVMTHTNNKILPPNHDLVNSIINMCLESGLEEQELEQELEEQHETSDVEQHETSDVEEQHEETSDVDSDQYTNPNTPTTPNAPTTP